MAHRMSSPEAEPSVLVVDDERPLADLYSEWLAEHYDVLTAYDGPEALSELDETVDVVLLDRRMPELSGDDVLEDIREADLDCGVAMVTAVDPDRDVAEMPFDTYVTKPLTREALRQTVEALLARQQYDAGVQEYFALVSKRVTLETASVADDADEFQRLRTRIADLERDIQTTLEEFSEEDFRAMFGALETPREGWADDQRGWPDEDH